MGNYIDQGNIEDRWGEANVATWSTLDSNVAPPTADTTRIASAITYAEAKIDDALRTRQYTTPVVGTSGSVPAIIIDIAAVLAGYWLFSSRGISDDDLGERMEGIRDESLSELQGYATGQTVLAAERSNPEPDTPFMV